MVSFSSFRPLFGFSPTVPQGFTELLPNSARSTQGSMKTIPNYRWLRRSTQGSMKTTPNYRWFGRKNAQPSAVMYTHPKFGNDIAKLSMITCSRSRFGKTIAKLGIVFCGDSSIDRISSRLCIMLFSYKQVCQAMVQYILFKFTKIVAFLFFVLIKSCRFAPYNSRYFYR
ncbi:unnamed protein product [Adineta ricciae]|uniref:Uncharacterized protein n=1 Tax=Adineta ricciae TaxID=249248 RepID=A0A815IYQ9_ADIRI|nr:unnamed protein product [Adineta ricciae]